MFVIRVFGASCDYWLAGWDAGRVRWGGSLARRDAAEFASEPDARDAAQRLHRAGVIGRWEITRA